MAAHRILFLDEGSLSAWRLCGGRVEAEGEFAGDAEGVAAFAGYLRQRRGSRYFLLADVADEGFQREDIPPLSGRSRRALIERRLERLYPATPLTAAWTLGRQAHGRRDERMLFAALTRPQQFAPWLDALTAERAAPAGVFTLPQTAAALAGAGGDGLLINLTRAGLRQTLVEHGRLRFSRLTPLPGATIAEAAAACAREAAKLYHYLDGQRLIAADAPLAVRVLAHPAQAAIFRAHCRDSDELRYDTLDLAAEAARCGLKTVPADSHAETLFMHLLVRHTPRTGFADAAARRRVRLGRMRVALRLAGGALFAAGLSVAAVQALELRRLRAATADLRAAADDAEHRYQARLAALPAPPRPERLLALTGRYEDLLRRSPGPAPMVRRIAAALDASPGVELDALHWAITERGEEGAEAASAGVVADIEARLPLALAPNARGQRAAVAEFAARLRAAGIDVQLLGLPGDAESEKALTGNGDALPPAPPTFRLRVVQRLEQP